MIDGKQVYFEFFGQYPQKVRDERDGWLRLFDGHREGWADKADFLLSRDATAYFTDRINADPKDIFAWGSRGIAWKDRGEFDNAIKDYTEWIRLDPNSADAFINRGNAHRAKKEYDSATRDYTEAIRLDPKCVIAYHNRSVARLLLRQPESADGFRTVLDLEGGKGENSPFAVIRGHLAARLNGDAEEAKRFLTERAAKLGKDWPYPVVEYLRGDIAEAALLKLATDDDKRAGARCYLGFDLLIKGKTNEAAAHFRWVNEHGKHDFTEYTIAVAELDRMEKAKK